MNLKDQRGFGLIEVVVASAIITVSLTGLVFAGQQSLRFSRSNLLEMQAATLMEEGAEAVKLVRDEGWSNIGALNVGDDYYFSFVSGDWTLSTTANTIDDFTRTVVFEDVYRDGNDDISASGSTLDEETKFVTVTVDWNFRGGARSIDSSFYIANIFDTEP